MAMTILNNAAAQSVLGELERNNKRLGKSAQKVASGRKLNGAGDGAAEYAISEKMKVRLRALEQDSANAHNGKDLVATAEGGIQEILNNLRNMKEMAINAANDHNTDADRDTIQKEQDARLQTIDDIAATTNYNGRLLLNGDYGHRKISTDTSLGPAGAAVVMTNGDYTINTDGTYMMPIGYSGRIKVNATNVKIIQEDPTEQHYKTAIECTVAGTSLWLDNVKLTNGSNVEDPKIDGFTDAAKNNNTVKFTGAGNTLNILNNVSLIGGCNGAENSAQEKYAVVNIGGGLSIYGKGNNSYLYVDDRDGVAGNPQAAGIGSDRGQALTGNITISGLAFLKASSEMGAGIGAAVNGSVGNITIMDIGLIRVASREGAGIGAGGGGTCGNIIIGTQKLYGNVSTVNGAMGSVIGRVSSGYGSSACGTVDIYSPYIFLTAKNVTSSNGDYYSPVDTNGATILADTVTVNDNAFNSSGHTYSAAYTNGQVYEINDPDAVSSLTADKPLRGLVIHTGTKANENLWVTINSMDTGTIGVSGILMKPRENAEAAIDVIDNAIEYSLNESTRMGAYQSRLDFVIDNLITGMTSTQAADSVICDADMAREMTAYAKNSVLSQSSQAMLAQANQNSSSVLQLLK